MVMLNIDLNGVEGTETFGSIPAGNYIAHIVNSVECFSKNTDNEGLSFTWQIMEGEYRGRLVFDRVWLAGSDKCKEMGARRLKAIAVAGGHRNPNYIGDSTELHGRVCQIKVGTREWNGDIQNEVKSVSAVKAAPGQTLAPQATPVRATPPPPPPKRVTSESPVSAPPVQEQWTAEEYQELGVPAEDCPF